MSEATPPFFVFEGRDLSLYDDFHSIEVGLEGVDVDDGVYEVFDATGRIVHLRASGVKRGRFWVDIGKVHVDGVEPEPTGAERLYNLLYRHLAEVGQSPSDEATLKDLVARCTAVHQHPS